jgi:branched-chain amino acid transport system substrate-binding protein
MKRKLIGIGMLLMVLALLFTLAPACGDDEDEGEVRTLKIGFMGALSGPAAPWGTGHERGVKWAADDINAAGGIKVGKDTYLVQVISCDTQYTGSVAAECSHQLIHDEGILYTIGTIGTAEAVWPIFQENACVLQSLSAAYMPSPDKPDYINGCVHYKYWVRAFYEQAVEYFTEIQKIAVINPNDNMGHISEVDGKEAAEVLGLDYVTAFYEYGTTDFYPILTNILQENPDALDTGMSPAGDQALMTKQARELGFTGVILHPNWVPTDLLRDIVGLDNLYKVATSLPDFSSDFYSPQMQELNRRYFDEGYAQPGEVVMSDTAVHGYSHMMFYKKAFEEAGTLDKDEVMKVLDNPNFRFERYYYPNAELGGIETFGIRRMMGHFNPFGVIEVEDDEVIAVQLSGKIVSTP